MDMKHFTYHHLCLSSSQWLRFPFVWAMRFHSCVSTLYITRLYIDSYSHSSPSAATSHHIKWQYSQLTFLLVWMTWYAAAKRFSNHDHHRTYLLQSALLPHTCVQYNVIAPEFKFLPPLLSKFILFRSIRFLFIFTALFAHSFAFNYIYFHLYTVAWSSFIEGNRTVYSKSSVKDLSCRQKLEPANFSSVFHKTNFLVEEFFALIRQKTNGMWFVSYHCRISPLRHLFIFNLLLVNFAFFWLVDTNYTSDRELKDGESLW